MTLPDSRPPIAIGHVVLHTYFEIRGPDERVFAVYSSHVEGRPV